MKRDDRLLCGGLFAGVLLAYLGAPSAFYNFDGVACAIAVELGDLRNLAHGNHVAYGLVGLAFDRLWRLLGYAGPAILPLDALSSLLGAATCAVFASTLRRAGCARATTLAGALGLAVSQAFWFWHLEAQVYPLGVFFLALTAREALAERPRPWLVGLFNAGAVLGHVGHVMFAPAALYLLKRGRSWKRDWVEYAATAAAVVIAGYALAVVFCLKPRDTQDLRLWLLGSAALKVDHSVTWYGGWTPASAWEWAKMSARIFAEPAGTAASKVLGRALALCGIGAAVAGAWLGKERRLVNACLLWIAAYALLFGSWEPFMPVYRIGDLLALWLLAVLFFKKMPLLLAVYVAALCVYNAATEVLPRSQPANNAAYQEALLVGGRTPENAWIVVTGMGQVYVPYFAHRRSLNLRYFESRLDALPSRLEDLRRAGEPAYVTASTLESGAWRGVLESYGLTEVARRGDAVLFLLRKTGTRAAAAKRS